MLIRQGRCGAEVRTFPLDSSEETAHRSFNSVDRAFPTEFPLFLFPGGRDRELVRNKNSGFSAEVRFAKCYHRLFFTGSLSGSTTFLAASLRSLSALRRLQMLMFPGTTLAGARTRIVTKVFTARRIDRQIGIDGCLGIGILLLARETSPIQSQFINIHFCTCTA